MRTLRRKEKTDIVGVVYRHSYFEKGSRKKKHQSARDKAESWSDYTMEFYILA